METTRYILAIDPSTVRLGWASLQYPYAAVSLSKLKEGWNYGSFELPSGTIGTKMRAVGEFVGRLDVGAQCVRLVAEMPMFMSSEAGLIAAREGYTINLAMVLGYVIGQMQVPTTLYTPAQWKGQVPKDVTRKKFFRTFSDARDLNDWGDDPTYDHDCLDAIMILRHWLELKLQNAA